jgi:hypothetical protein
LDFEFSGFALGATINYYKMGALFTILLTLGPFIASQVTLPPTAEQERAAYIEQLETEVAQLPKIKPDSIEQVVKFSIEQNMLSPRTELLVKSEISSHVIESGLPGYVRVALLGPQDAPEVRGRNFTYIQHDLTDPHALVITTVSCIAGQIILARDGENERYHWSVQLVQDAPPAPGAIPDQDPIRFLVRRDATDTEKELDLKLSGANLAQLRSEHAAELDAYLRPILRDFKQEGAVFGVPPHVAWQVLGTDSTIDPAMLEKVQKTVSQLDADDFRDRQNAAEQLRQLGQPAALALAKLDRTKLSLQQIGAIDAFLAEFAPASADQVNGLANDKSFLLDVLFNDDSALRELALKRLHGVTGRKVLLEGDVSARAVEIAKLRAELVPSTQPSLAPAN